MRFLLPIAAMAAALVLCAASIAKEAVPMAQDEATEQRMIAISEDLRCLVCQNESLAGSRAELAEDLRKEVREMIRAGKSDKEITDYLVNRYGDFVLYRPPLKPVTWLLWFGPFVLLLGALAGLAIYLRSRGRRLGDEPADATEASDGHAPGSGTQA